MDDWEVVDLERELRRAYEEAGQGHVFDWCARQACSPLAAAPCRPCQLKRRWESLNATEKAHLLSQLQLVDPADLPRIREQVRANTQGARTHAVTHTRTQPVSAPASSHK
jgi:hypothetical protein